MEPLNIYVITGEILKSLTKGNDIHLLIYHCLDVAAVADCWWDQSVVLQNAFAEMKCYQNRR